MIREGMENFANMGDINTERKGGKIERAKENELTKTEQKEQLLKMHEYGKMFAEVFVPEKHRQNN